MHAARTLAYIPLDDVSFHRIQLFTTCVKNKHERAAKILLHSGYMYHVYSTVWEAAIGGELACEREHNNARYRYAVAVGRNEVI